MNNTTKTRTAICVFAYKRPDHLSACLSALRENKEARELDLRIYVDGPKHVADANAHHKVLNVCDQAWPLSSFKVIKRKENVGIYKSLTSGVSETLLDYKSVIVIEDDIEASPFLVRYLLDGLNLYQNTKEVASIHGYTPPIKEELPQTFFLRGADCWGWATWRDRWDLFRHDAATMAAEIRQRGLVDEFNLNGAYDYLAMLDARANGLNNSWAICWHASCFLANKLTLYPGKSLVKNIGLDGSGEHCGASKVMETEATPRPVRVRKIVPEVHDNIYRIYCNHFSTQKLGVHNLILVLKKLKNKLSQIIYQQIHSNLTLSGPYANYNEAKQRSTGYASIVIIEKVYDAVVELLEGNGTYERDGTLFDTRPRHLPIEKVITQYAPRLSSIIDFGGGLGGMFLSYADLIPQAVAKHVVEQKRFAEAGSAISSKYNLDITYHHDLSSINLGHGSSLLILSGVLMYLPDWRSELNSLLTTLAPEIVFIDRQALECGKGPDSFYIQHCSSYYSEDISYPFVLPSTNEFILALGHSGYKIVKKGRNPLHTGWPKHFYYLLQKKSTNYVFA